MQSKARAEPLLYAEHLPNIRQITLYISLPDWASASSPIPASATSTSPTSTPQNGLSLSLCASRLKVSLTLRNQTFCLQLPARVSEESCKNLSLNPSPTSRPVFTCPYPKDRELSFRLQADESISSCVPGNHGGCGDDGMQIPWVARDMCSQTRVRDRDGGNV